MRILVRLMLLSSLMVFLCITANPAFADSDTVVFTIGSTSYTVNGQVYDMDVAPVIVGDRTLVPLRYLANALGISDANILWDPVNQLVTIQSQSTILILQIGHNSILVSTPGMSHVVTMDTAATIINNRAYLPARYVAQQLGYTVQWDVQTQQVLLTRTSSQGGWSAASGQGVTQGAMTNYQNSTAGISFSYPSSWQQVANSPVGIVTIQSDNDKARLLVMNLIQADSHEATLSYFAHAIIDSIPNIARSSINVQSESNTTVNGLPAYVETAIIPEDGKDAETSIYLTRQPDSDTIYGFIYANTPDAFSTDLPTISRILSTVNIASGN